MSNPDQICFYTESGDTNSFGSSIAINDKYMTVGDFNANRVVIYQRDSRDQWIWSDCKAKWKYFDGKFYS